MRIIPDARRRDKRKALPPRQGERDPAVMPAQSETLIRELERRRIDHEYASYLGEGHGFRKVATTIDYAQRIDRFLCQKVLRAPEPGPLGTLPYPPMPHRDGRR